jgi:hypothetical protein
MRAETVLPEGEKSAGLPRGFYCCFRELAAILVSRVINSLNKSDEMGAMRRCNPCRARLRLQAQTVSQAGSMLPEFPASPS